MGLVLKYILFQKSGFHKEIWIKKNQTSPNFYQQRPEEKIPNQAKRQKSAPQNKIPPCPKLSSVLLTGGPSVVVFSLWQYQALGRGNTLWHMLHAKGLFPARRVSSAWRLRARVTKRSFCRYICLTVWSKRGALPGLHLALQIESQGTRTMWGYSDTHESFDLLVGCSDTKQGSFERSWGHQWWPR